MGGEAWSLHNALWNSKKQDCPTQDKKPTFVDKLLKTFSGGDPDAQRRYNEVAQKIQQFASAGRMPEKEAIADLCETLLGSQPQVQQQLQQQQHAQLLQQQQVQMASHLQLAEEDQSD